MHLQQLPSGKWRVIVQHAGRKRTGTALTRSGAQQVGAELLLEMGAQTVVKTMSVQELAANWLTSADISASYRVDARRVIDVMPDTFGQRAVVDVTPSIIEGLYRQLVRDGWTVNRVRRLHAVLSSAWTMARRYEWATVNPFTAAKRPSEPKRQMDPPTVDQVIRFLDGKLEAETQVDDLVVSGRDGVLDSVEHPVAVEVVGDLRCWKHPVVLNGTRWLLCAVARGRQPIHDGSGDARAVMHLINVGRFGGQVDVWAREERRRARGSRVDAAVEDRHRWEDGARIRRRCRAQTCC